MLCRGVGFLSRSTLLRTFASQAAFEQAQADLKKLKEEPDSDVKLKIYALFKQGTQGDVQGSRPGMMDFVKRAKYDAHAALKGTSQEDARGKYVELVMNLLGEESSSPEAATLPGLQSVNGLDVSIKDKIFHIRLNRPKKFNAITLDMYEGLIAALTASSESKTTSVTVLSAAGDYFCSGNDLSNFAAAASQSKEVVKKMAEQAGEVLRRYTQAYIDHNKPLIGLVQGPAVGIAVTILPMFDLVVASDKATFVTPFATLGQSPEAASSYSFPLVMGPAKAAEVLLLGRKLTAEDAARLGLVGYVVPAERFEETAWADINKMANLPPESLRLNKILLRNVHRAGLTKANNDEIDLIVERWQSKECANAIASFLSRKK